MKQIDLADQLGITQATLSNWERGIHDPDNDTLLTLSKLFGVSTDYLLGVSDKSNQHNTHSKGVWIPVLGTVAAGIPIEAVEDIIDYEEIDMNMAKSGEHFGLLIKGVSMEPKISEGDVVIVRRQQDVENGEIAIVLVNGDEATCKKVCKHDNGISLVSTNPACSPMFYTLEETENLPISILGKVVELRAKF